LLCREQIVAYYFRLSSWHLVGKHRAQSTGQRGRRAGLKEECILSSKDYQGILSAARRGRRADAGELDGRERNVGESDFVLVFVPTLVLRLLQFMLVLPLHLLVMPGLLLLLLGLLLDLLLRIPKVLLTLRLLLQELPSTKGAIVLHRRSVVQGHLTM